MSTSSTKIKYLVADTTAFINAVPLNEYADNVLTVPEVVAEVRNKRQIRRLCVLPFDLQVREPRPESVKHCVQFAKKTGDYASLSGIDLKVISLTYELEADTVGTEHLRNEPVVSQVIASKDKPEEMQDVNNKRLVGWYMPEGNEEDDEGEEEEEEEDEDDNEQQLDKVDHIKAAIEAHMDGTGIQSPENKPTDARTDIGNDNEDDDDLTQEELDKLFEKLQCAPSADEERATCDLLVAESKEEDEDDQEEQQTQQANEKEIDEDVGDDGWITHSNIKKAKKALEGKVETDIVPPVACMTTDYALQNVLKQLNLQLAALNGRIIKQLRTYILRCYGCFKTTSIMTKVFCPNCGNKTLKRVAVSLDENGKQVLHINTRRSLTAKYKNQSLPRFQGGKHSRNPILFEDQPMPRQMPSRVAKTKTNALDDDYIAGFSPFVMRDVDSKSAMLRSKGNLKEWARNNNFEEDRRRKNYNRLYK
ncbi:RNA-binding protein NOB1 [Drosophila grimshawi]|uniref:RNA-binding protein NOB1 n=1 Tax=Drosophila grimshawi TaxID=7222 RepID=B4JJQ4_DROGR|nr:RNA-binding protein NOB1 [Drosophila grimshawi]EDV99806.1 GH12205 [Drosophila grimshawi]